MGYFDGLTSGYFKTAQDGHRLYFPWGFWGRGYVMASEDDYENLRRQLKIYHATTLVAIIACAGVHWFIASFVVAALAIAFYAIWSRSLVADLSPTEERITWRAVQASQARAFGPVVLWVLEVLSLIFVAIGVVVLIADPADWPLAMLVTVFFGACAATMGYMIVLQRRPAPSP